MLEIQPGSQQYFTELKELRDTALINSRYSGKRRKLGSFAWGTVLASWHDRADNIVMLEDLIVPKRQVDGYRMWPNELYVHNESNQPTTFKFDVESRRVSVHHNIAFAGTSYRAVRERMEQERIMQTSGQSVPNIDDLEYLYDTLHRGASLAPE